MLQKINKEKIASIAFIAIFFVVMLKGYLYTFVFSDFSIKTPVFCDPTTESGCFVSEGEFYKYAVIGADLYDECNTEDTCVEICVQTDSCEIIYCDADTVGSDEECFVIPY